MARQEGHRRPGRRSPVMARKEEAVRAREKVDGTTGRLAARGEAVAGVVAATRRACRRQLLPLLPSTSPKLDPPLSGTVAWEEARRPTRSMEEAVDVATCEVDDSNVCGRRPLRVADAGSGKGGRWCARPRQAAHEEVGSVQVARGQGKRGGNDTQRGARCRPTRRLVGRLPSHATTTTQRVWWARLGDQRDDVVVRQSEVGAASLGAMELGNDNTLQFSRGAGVSFLRCLWQR
uniref:Uncharacterized protein n=1 Tax=Oryza meridionalis TaxID=40149 RepID=A0A0E0DR22_9ORYZ